MSDGMTDNRSQPDAPKGGQYIGLSRSRSDGTDQLRRGELELIEMLAEEGGEIVQSAMKIARHGFNSVNPTLPPMKQITNVRHLEEEVLDLLAVISLLRRAGLVDINFAQASPTELDRRALSKLKYAHYQGQLVDQLTDRLDATLQKTTDYLNDR